DRNHTRRHCGELGHKFADAGAAARDNKAFFGRPHHHIEPILRNIDSDNDRVHLIPPCASGLAVRPKRLFGFDGTAGENPRSPTGLASLGGFGLSPATAPVTLTRAVIRELQGGVSALLRIAERSPHPRSPRSSRGSLNLSPHAGRGKKEKMFDNLSKRLNAVLDRLTRRGALSEADVDAAL